MILDLNKAIAETMGTIDGITEVLAKRQTSVEVMTDEEIQSAMLFLHLRLIGLSLLAVQSTINAHINQQIMHVVRGREN